MNAKWMKAVAIAAALAAAPVAAVAQTSVQTRPMADHGYGATVSGTAAGTPYSAPAAQDDLDLWMQDYSVRNNGRISREAYLDEMGRRWDAMDANRGGLSPAEVSRLTGRVDSNAPAPLTGTGVQPGNMGPGNSKGK